MKQKYYIFMNFLKYMNHWVQLITVQGGLGCISAELVN